MMVSVFSMKYDVRPMEGERVRDVRKLSLRVEK